MKQFYVLFSTCFHWAIILDFETVVTESEYSIMRGSAVVDKSLSSRIKLPGLESWLYHIIAT